MITCMCLSQQCSISLLEKGEGSWVGYWIGIAAEGRTVPWQQSAGNEYVCLPWIGFFSLQISKTTPWFKHVFLRLQSVFVLFLFVCFFKMNIWGSYNSNCAVLGYYKGAYQNILLNIILSLEGMELESLIMKDLEESDGLYSALSQKCQFLWQK